MSKLKIANKNTKPSFLLITSNQYGKVFEITAKGEVWWLKGKEFVQAKTDTQLSKALGRALNQLVEINIGLKNRMKTETLKPTKPGQKPITFKKGALHKELGVPAGKKIPAKKMAAAEAGKKGPLAEKRANFAKNVLTGGRRGTSNGYMPKKG